MQGLPEAIGTPAARGNRQRFAAVRSQRFVRSGSWMRPVRKHIFSGGLDRGLKEPCAVEAIAFARRLRQARTISQAKMLPGSSRGGNAISQTDPLPPAGPDTAAAIYL